jgi:hypothetical protein
MSEQENVGTDGQPTEKKTKKQINRGPWASFEEAQQHKPEGDKVKLWRVADPLGKVVWVWHIHSNSAITVAAKAAGWKSSSAGKPVSKEKVSDLLGQLSPEDRAILIAQFVPATSEGKKGKK